MLKISKQKTPGILLLMLSFYVLSCNRIADTGLISGHGIRCDGGMVVSAHPEASLIGAQILKAGGNSVDAAVATGFALAVCYPSAGNIGGGGLMLMRMADGSVSSLDFREKAPLEAHRDMYLDDNDKLIDGLSTQTHLASGVPGSVKGLFEAHAKYGSMDFNMLVQPALNMALKGFPVTASQARSLNSLKNKLSERNRSVTAFQKDKPWAEGDTLRQPELAATLMFIRDKGPDGFYKGPVADLIINEMKRGDGLISRQDLEEYEAVWREPVRMTYRDYDLISMPPPSSGGVALKQLLGMIEPYPVAEWGPGSAETVHLMVEAERRVYADRSKYMGDPDYVDIPVEDLTCKPYLESRMSDFNPLSASLSSLIGAGVPSPCESEETTHYSVVDSFGNAVSVTTTLNSSYGNCIVVEGAGFLLNNEMDDFSGKPGVPNLYGLVGGEANSIEPGKRMLSSMTPTIVEKDEKLFMVLGSPGGSTIITTVFQVLVNVLDHGMDMQKAVDEARFHHQWLPDLVSFEEGRVDSTILTGLKSRGHKIKPRSSIGRVDAIKVTNDNKLEGGADKRGDDIATGY